MEKWKNSMPHPGLNFFSDISWAKNNGYWLICYLAAIFLRKYIHLVNLFEMEVIVLVINEEIMAFEENSWFGERILKVHV